MQKLKITRLFNAALVVGALSGAACGGQTPAPVVSGFAEPGVRSAPVVGSSPVVEEVYKPTGVQTLYHVVARGDTLWGLAQRYKTSATALKSLNGLSDSTLYVGQRLKVSHTQDEAIQRLENRQNQQVKSFTNRIASGGAASVSVAPSKAKQGKPQAAKQVPTPQGLGYVSHRVRAGENLFRIGLKYHVSPLDIMAENDLAKPEDLQAGSVIRVPVVQETQTLSGTVAERTVNETLARQRGFIWPAKGKVLHKFGRQGDGVINNGIKIKLAESAPIHAAEAGKVIYADSGLKTYGNLILLRHQGGMITAYAHNSQNMVKRNDTVKKGEVIALAGMTGNASTPQLHFEMRRNARAIDPLKILP